MTYLPPDRITVPEALERFVERAEGVNLYDLNRV
jgi:hypothetical protein